MTSNSARGCRFLRPLDLVNPVDPKLSHVDFNPSVSMKGVVIVEDHVILLQNERNEWELPGGKPVPGETPEDTVAREISEELNISVIVGGIVDAWMYEICTGTTVLLDADHRNSRTVSELDNSHLHRACLLFRTSERSELSGIRRHVEIIAPDTDQPFLSDLKETGNW